MKITVNGKEKVVIDDITVKALLTELKLEGKVMAAAVNMEIVKQDQWDKHKLQENDTLELLDFVGGG